MPLAGPGLSFRRRWHPELAQERQCRKALRRRLSPRPQGAWHERGHIEPAGPPHAGRPGPTEAVVRCPRLASHLARFGPLRVPAAEVLKNLAAAGLKGRGGAGFPTARKIATVASTGVRAVVVANGTEGEPLSMKDKVLLTNSPHLVLDGLALAADLVGATRRVVCIESGNPTVEVAVRRVCWSEVKRGRGLRDASSLRVRSRERPGRPHQWRPGQANTGPAVRAGCRWVATLVDNVETLAHLALIARYDPHWYREVGTAEDPGSTLVTIGGSVGQPGVYEVAHGWRLEDVLATSAHTGRGLSSWGGTTGGGPIARK